jgi:hypothetical protein
VTPASSSRPDGLATLGKPKKGPSPWRRSSLRSCQSMLQIDLAFLLLLDFGKPFLNFTE